VLTLDALVKLSRASGRAMYMKDLAAALVYSTSGVTRLVDKLEQAGHVTRSPDPANRRATLVGLTSRGRYAMESAWASQERALQRLFARHVDVRQAKVLVEVFSAVSNDLHASR
jgi:DNA-binding MarR family transcriptional regulator